MYYIPQDVCRDIYSYSVIDMGQNRSFCMNNTIKGKVLICDTDYNPSVSVQQEVLMNLTNCMILSTFIHYIIPCYAPLKLGVLYLCITSFFFVIYEVWPFYLYYCIYYI